ELAANAHGIQAIGLGPHIRGVQFHPELSAEGMSRIVRVRTEALEREGAARGLLPGERSRSLLAGVRPTPFGRLILRNFLTQLVGARARKSTSAGRETPRAPAH